ncbi:MAG: alpha/beta hydrolase [Pseudomonadota bacterium]
MKLKFILLAILSLIVIARAAHLFVFADDKKQTSVDWTSVSFRGMELESRTVLTDDGTELTLARGTIKVPEVRVKNNSRKINIGFMVAPRLEGAGDIPVFMVAGGPGGSHIRNIEKPWVHQLITMYRQVGDVVMVDLRGIETSTPNFDLKGPENKIRIINSRADLHQLQRDAGRAGRLRLIEKGFDLDGYVVTEAAADVISVADALGYDTINMYGTSFGSHYTFVTVREFPNRINRFVVTGLEGYDHTYDDGVAVQKAVRKIAKEAEGVWDGAYGAKDPYEALDTLIKRSEAGSKEAHGLRPYEAEPLIISADYFGFKYRLSNRDGMRSWPADVARIIEGERTWRIPLVRRALPFFVGKSSSDAAVGLFDCASYISSARRKRLEETAPKRFPNNTEDMLVYCSGWGVEPLPESFQAGTILKTPGLFVQGTYDTSTPYENAIEMLDQFPNAELVTIHGGSHGALWEALDAREEFASEVANWLSGGDAPPDLRLDPIPFDPLP